MHHLSLLWRQLKPFCLYPALILGITAHVGPAGSETDFKIAPALRDIQLENGLRVLISPRSHGELVGIHLFVRAGSLHEQSYSGSGISHLLEHLCFKGTEDQATSELAKEVRRQGGSINAYTTFDHTCYFLTYPSAKAKEAINLMADLVLKPRIEAEDIQREKEVIEREIDMGKDNPVRTLHQKFFQAAYSHCPVRYPIIGYKEILRQLTREDILTYYQQWYQPVNMVLVIAGQIDPQEIQPWVEETFGEPTSQFLPLQLQWNEPRPLSPKSKIRYHHPLPYPMGRTAWQTVPMDHPDVPALDILAVLLGGMKSSPLRENLVLPGHLLSAGSSSYTPAFPGLLEIHFNWQDGSLEEKLKLLENEVRVFKENLMDPADLAKAVTQMQLGVMQEMETVLGECRHLGSQTLYTHDPRYAESWLQALSMVTPQDIQTVAQKYLDPQTQVTMALLPESTREKHNTPPILTPQRPVLHTLESGLRLILLPNPESSLVYYTFAHLGGALGERPGQEGLSALMGQLYARASSQDSENEINPMMDQWGASLSAFSGRNTFGASGKVLRSHYEEWLPHLLALLTQPVFDGDLAAAQQKLASSINKQLETPVSRAGLQIRKLLYGKSHPYGRLTEGNLENLATFSQPSIQAYWQQIFHPEHAVLVMSGDIDPDTLIFAIEAFLAAPQKAPQPLPAIPSVTFQEKVDKLKFPAQQAVVILGYPTVPLTHPDRLALELLGYYLSGQASPLFNRIREEASLAYSVGARSENNWLAGHFMIFALTTPNKEGTVIEMIDEVLTELARAPLDKAVFQDTLQGFLGVDLRSKESPGDLTLRMALDTLYEQPFDSYLLRSEEIKALTPETLHDVVQRYLAERPRIVVSLKDEDPNHDNRT